MKKNLVFPKNEGDGPGSGEKYFYRRSATRMRIFRLYVAAMSTLVFDGQLQKTKFSTFGRFGVFPTSDVILKENFCRLFSIWLIDLMKLFALGRIDSALEAVKFRLAG